MIVRNPIDSYSVVRPQRHHVCNLQLSLSFSLHWLLIRRPMVSMPIDFGENIEEQSFIVNDFVYSRALCLPLANSCIKQYYFLFTNMHT